MRQRLAAESFDLLIDVGANIGQFVSDIRYSGYTGRILSFEPASEPFQKLQFRASRSKQWYVYNMALGSTIGKQVLHNSANTDLSSSLLPMARLHETLFPGSFYKSSEVVNLNTLDNFLTEESITFARGILKMDVQGFELEVLKGAESSLSKFSLIICEVSLVSLYEGQVTLEELCTFLNPRGFGLTEIFPSLTKSKQHQIQVDVVFAKNQESSIPPEMKSHQN